MHRFLLDPGPGSGTKHAMTEDRYIVEDKWRKHVYGKNILIVDDTWTTGASAQGAAIAVKKAGAATATILCVDRWLRWDWSDHKRIIDSLADSTYDVLRCPVNGQVCNYATDFTMIEPGPKRI